MSKTERKHVQKMRNMFALKESDAKPLSVEEMAQQTKDRVAQRFEEAKRRAALKQRD